MTLLCFKVKCKSHFFFLKGKSDSAMKITVDKLKLCSMVPLG